MEPAGDSSDVLVERIGAARAEELLEELAAHGLVVVDVEHLARIEHQAAGYRRLAALVEESD